MGIFGLIGKGNMLNDITACRNAGGVILDVRSGEEYADGHIPGSINIPVNRMEEAKNHIKSKDMPVCVYCLSGIRSAAAAKKLVAMGYTKVKDLGSLKKYKGKMER